MNTRHTRCGAPSFWSMRSAVACAAIALAAMTWPAVRGDDRAAPAQLAGVTPGPNVSLHGARPFAPDDPWNVDVSKEPVDPNSSALIESIGAGKGLHPDFGANPNYGIPYVVVTGEQPKVRVDFQYKDESDPGPYPVPRDAPIEGGPNQKEGDRHVLVIDRDHGKLYELFAAEPQEGGSWWKAGSGAVWDLSRSSVGQRPAGWTSADAAGLPVFPGLVRYDEVAEQKAIRHALRFTAVRTRHAYVAPATHFASARRDAAFPPMGMRVRLKADFDTSKFPPHVQVILTAMKTYGMILADNGSNWFVSGAPDPRWDDDELHALGRVKGSDFEVVKMGPVVTR